MQIYVLIRTCNRPKLFKRCYQSVLNSTIKLTPIVVYDSEDKPNHVPNDVISFPASKVQRIGCFYNLFCNDLLQKVSEMEDGYFFFLDDDDYIYDIGSVKRMLPHLEEDKAVLCQFLRGHRLKPNNTLMKTKQIVSGMIGLPCIFLHNKHALLSKFNGNGNADYEFIKDVCSKINSKFVTQAVVMSPTRSHGALYV